MLVRVQTEDFDLSTEVRQLRENNPQIGAVVSFLGLVRDLNDGQNVSAMELEHYPVMTEKALQDIAAQAAARWSVTDSLIIHRIGVLLPLIRLCWWSLHHNTAVMLSRLANSSWTTLKPRLRSGRKSKRQLAHAGSMHAKATSWRVRNGSWISCLY